MKTQNADTFRAILDRVYAATDKPALERVEKQATRIYNAGLLTVNQFKRLDVKIMERLGTME